MLKNTLFLVLTLLILGCSGKKTVLKIAATSTPHAQLLEFIQDDLKSQGIHLKIIIADNYNVPNLALAFKEVDANFFQHIPFLEEQNQLFHYPITSIATVEIEPLGIYSKKVRSLAELKESATIAVPCDYTNKARALRLLQEHGVIQLRDKNSHDATMAHIIHNPKQIRFVEVDAAVIAHSIDVVDAAAINANFAMQANLSPLRDALALEDKNSPYANIIAVRIGEENRPEIQALKAALTSEKMKEFINQKYRGAILPAF